MSDNSYKKRAKGSWNVGKACKGDSEERGYAQKEIDEDLKSIDEDYLTPHKGKRKKNVKARLEYRIAWYTQILEKSEKSKYSNDFTRSLRDGLREAKEELEEFLKGGKK